MKNSINIKCVNLIIAVVLCGICNSCFHAPHNPYLGLKVHTRLMVKYPLKDLTTDTIVSLSSIVGVECDEIFMFSPVETRSQIAYAIASDDFEFRNSNQEHNPYVIIRHRGKTVKSGDWTDDIKLYLPFSKSIEVPPYCNFKGEPYVFPFATCVGPYGHLKATHVVLGKRKDDYYYYPTDEYCIFPADISSSDSLLNNRFSKYYFKDGEFHSMEKHIWGSSQMTKERLENFISDNVRFPEENIKNVNSIPERVVVLITIEHDGQISKTELLKPRGDYWDEEALRVVGLFQPDMFAPMDEQVVRVMPFVPFDFRKIYEEREMIKSKSSLQTTQAD